MSDEYYKRQRSSRPGKKWMVRVPTSSGRGKVVHFGDATMQDFTQHKDTARRERYWNRHQRDNLDDPGSPGFWSWYALWGQSSSINTAFADAVRRAKRLGGARRNPALPWVSFLPDAQSFAEAGFYFSEGGCWGFALAVQDEIGGVLKVNTTDYVHAWVEKDGIVFDAEGQNSAQTYPLAGETVSREQIVKKAESFGVPEYKVDADRAWAAEIIASAKELQAASEARTNPQPTAVALHERFDELCGMINTYAALVVDEEAALAGRDPRSPRAFAATDGYVVYVRPKLAEQTVERIDGVLMHELGHVILIQHGYPEHTERECDECAEGAFGIAICYDADDVQTTGLGVRPRPAHLDVRQNPGRCPC